MEFNKTLKFNASTDVPYGENLDPEGYSYGLLFNWDGREGYLFICESGIHIEWEDSEDWTVSPIIPKKIWPDLKKLTEYHLRFILNKMIKDEFKKGSLIEAETINKFYKEWTEKNDSP